MAYNLQSLITILQKILNPEEQRWNVDHNKPRLESLLEKARFLQQILEKSSLTKIGSLESQIRDAAYQAEDVIESSMFHQMLCTPQGMRFTLVTPYLQKVTQRLDSAKEQVVKLVEGKAMLTRTGASSSHDLTPDEHQTTQRLESLKHVEVEVEVKEMSAISSWSAGSPSSSLNKYLVGIDEDLLQLNK
ncbi:hypothetical protein SASPL_147631 [Salvia splendens]|uniref:Rx N-terminal domain-containing protein n=1 Tax=Salvia splendens TaxID=180675 RepID=A0A8X8WDZ6_SALSN|nr:hypothetical protein SASPL_147631 [Salvia splendens]